MITVNAQLIPEEFFEQVEIFDNNISNAEITVSSNNFSYKPGDRAILTGYVIDVQPGQRIFIEIIDSLGNIRTKINVAPTYEGLYSVQNDIPVDVKPGEYAISAKYTEIGKAVLLPITIFVETDETEVRILPLAHLVESKINFFPDAIIVEAGKPIVWTNEDENVHTVVSAKKTVTNKLIPDGLFDSKTFAPGTKFTLVLDQVGDYNYFCKLHPWLTGFISIIPSTSPIPDENAINEKSEDEKAKIILDNAEDESTWKVSECDGCTSIISLSPDKKEGRNSIILETITNETNLSRTLFSILFESIDLDTIESISMWIKTKGNNNFDSQIAIIDSENNKRVLDIFNSQKYTEWEKLSFNPENFIMEEDNFNQKSVTGFAIITPSSESLVQKLWKVHVDEISVILKPIENNTTEDKKFLEISASRYPPLTDTTLLDDNISELVTGWKKKESTSSIKLQDITNAKTGANSLLTQVNTQDGPVAFRYDYGEDDIQDWTHYNFLEFWFKGTDSKKTIGMIVVRGEGWKFNGSYEITDDIKGWKKILVPINEEIKSLNKVRGFEIIFTDDLNTEYNFDKFNLLQTIDRSILDDNISELVTGWKKKESTSSIKLQDITNAKTGANSLLTQVNTQDGPVAFRYDYGEDDIQDWTHYNFLEFWFKGTDSKKTIASINLKNSAGSSLGQYPIFDDSKNWEKVIIPIHEFFKLNEKVRQLEIIFDEKLNDTEYLWDSFELRKNIDPLKIDEFKNFIQTETIFVSGKILERESDLPITISVLDPTKNLIVIDQIIPEKSKSFNFVLPTTGNQFKKGGLYTILAQYGVLEHKDKTNFVLTIPKIIDNIDEFSVIKVEEKFLAIPADTSFNFNEIKFGKLRVFFNADSEEEIISKIEKFSSLQDSPPLPKIPSVIEPTVELPDIRIEDSDEIKIPTPQISIEEFPEIDSKKMKNEFIWITQIIISIIAIIIISYIFFKHYIKNRNN